jgi:hypothetical protein
VVVLLTLIMMTMKLWDPDQLMVHLGKMTVN